MNIVYFKNKQLTKELILDKTGIIDVRAKTSKGENIDIEVQLTDQGNMDKRTLFYWGKMYLENIKQGQDYILICKKFYIPGFLLVSHGNYGKNKGKMFYHSRCSEPEKLMGSNCSRVRLSILRLTLGWT